VTAPDEERIALFLDYENLAIGVRESFGGAALDLQPLADALADRGRVIVRRAYADWTMFEPDRRALTRHHVELIEIPQRMGMVRKNAADIKLAVDAIELAFERDYVTTFVIGTGDSDFTPLVHKLRELDKRVIGFGIEGSTSGMLPPACDEFLFYDRLEGVERPVRRERARGRVAGEAQAQAPATEPEAVEEPATDREVDVAKLVTRTLSGLQRSGGEDAVRASQLKRAVLRRLPTFNEADYGFRGFGELLRHLESRGLVALTARDSTGDPEVAFPRQATEEAEAFALLADVVERAAKRGAPPYLSGLKNRLRKRRADFSEKEYGYGSFLQFVKAGQARGVVELVWDAEADDYVVRPSATAGGTGEAGGGGGSGTDGSGTDGTGTGGDGA
jgi:uncharacterized protein (TIGR00288 family)